MRVPDLRFRILFTLSMLVIYRFAANVPVPGVNRDALAAAFDNNALLGFFDLFSGGALRNLSIAALGVYPYITSSIIMHIMTTVVPSLLNVTFCVVGIAHVLSDYSARILGAGSLSRNRGAGRAPMAYAA